MIKSTLLFFSFIVLLSCNNPEQKEGSKTTDTTSINQIKKPSYQDSFTIGTYSSIPDTIDGCSALFKSDTSSVDNNFIFITNLQELALIKIDEKTIFLKLNNKEQISTDSYKETYSGEGYQVILSMKEMKKTGDEVALYTGTIEIIKGSLRRTINIQGEVGC